MLKKIPIVIRLNPDSIYNSDLQKELKIDRHRLKTELLRQAGRYAWWVSLHSEVLAKCEEIEDSVELLKSQLFLKYAKEEGKGTRKYDLVHRVNLNPKYQIAKARLRKWKKAERILRGAEKSWSQRQVMLQMLYSRERKEQENS